MEAWSQVQVKEMKMSQRKPKASVRAQAFDNEASGWHQGCGTHTSACQSVAEHFEVLADGISTPKRKAAFLAVAELWADAAEVEAKELRKTEGEWLSWRAWLKSPSGKATAKATKASQKVEPKFDFKDWQ
jgi:hypothetical protein